MQKSVLNDGMKSEECKIAKVGFHMLIPCYFLSSESTSIKVFIILLWI